MPFARNDDEEEDPTFDEVVGMADRLGLKGKGRATYIDDHMTQLGYEPIQSRESYRRKKRETEEDEQGTGRWGFGGGRGRSGGSSRSSQGDNDDAF